MTLATLPAARPEPLSVSASSVLALDPGYTRTAYVMLRSCGEVLEHGIEPNDALLGLLGHLSARCPHLAIERIEGYGMPVGAEVFGTVWWAGRLWERWCRTYPGRVAHWVTRRDVKLHLCGSSRAKDPHIRQALLDRYGPGKAAAVGTKRAPGPLHGIRRDEWAALAVGVTWLDSRRTSENAPENAFETACAPRGATISPAHPMTTPRARGSGGR